MFSFPSKEVVPRVTQQPAKVSEPRVPVRVPKRKADDEDYQVDSDSSTETESIAQSKAKLKPLAYNVPEGFESLHEMRSQRHEKMGRREEWSE